MNEYKIGDAVNYGIKLKLIDVLSMIERGELQEGARVIWDFKEYIYDGENSLWRESEYSDTGSRDIFEDICLGNLREEVELKVPAPTTKFNFIKGVENNAKKLDGNYK